MKRKVYYTVVPRTLGRSLNAAGFVAFYLLLEHLHAAHGWYILFWVLYGINALAFILSIVLYKEVVVDVQDLLKVQQQHNELKEAIKKIL